MPSADPAPVPTDATHGLLPLQSEAPLIIYLDFKSPYAYLAVAPARRMLAQMGEIADWRPFVLDIPSFLGSAKLDRGGKKVAQQNRSKEQWSDVKYAYFDCRRYANLAGQTLRGTVKVWDTDLPAIGMLWLKQFADLTGQCAPGSLLERYIDAIYAPFWKRELDVEDPSVIAGVLERIGAPVDGFLGYAQDEGAALNTRLQESAFAAGIYGVPTFILPGASAGDPPDDLPHDPLLPPSHTKFFGREHLPRIAWQLSGRRGPAPDMAYSLPPEADSAALALCAAEPRTAPELTGTPRRLTTYFDFKSPQSYLALPAILALKREGVAIDWRPFDSRPLKVPASAAADEDRGTKHRRIRGEYHATTIQRYAPHPLTDIYRDTDCRFADMGLLWLQNELRRERDMLDAYIQRVFVHLWRDGGAVDSAQAIEPLLLEAEGLSARSADAHPAPDSARSAGADTTDTRPTDTDPISLEEWRRYARGRGLEQLEAARARARSDSIGPAPTFLLGSEPFQGQAQLPLIAARLKTGI